MNSKNLSKLSLALTCALALPLLGCFSAKEEAQGNTPDMSRETFAITCQLEEPEVALKEVTVDVSKILDVCNEIQAIADYNSQEGITEKKEQISELEALTKLDPEIASYITSIEEIGRPAILINFTGALNNNVDVLEFLGSICSYVKGYFFYDFSKTEAFTVIPDDTFYDCDYLYGVKLPSTIQYVGRNVCSDNYFAELTIPKDVFYLGNGAFSSIRNLKIDPANKFYKIKNGYWTAR